MRPVRIEGHTRVLAEGQEEYLNLVIKDEAVEIPGVGTVNGMTSSWEPTPQQLAMLNAGGKIHLQIIGRVHPPVALWVVRPL